jgi:hypothetical protein
MPVLSIALHLAVPVAGASLEPSAAVTQEESAARLAYEAALNAASNAKAAYERAVSLRQPESILVGLRNALNAANATLTAALKRYEAARAARASQQAAQQKLIAQQQAALQASLNQQAALQAQLAAQQQAAQQPQVVNNYTTVQAPKDPKWGISVNPDGSSNVRTTIGGGSSRFALDLPLFGPSRSNVSETRVTEIYVTPTSTVIYETGPRYSGADPYAPQPIRTSTTRYGPAPQTAVSTPPVQVSSESAQTQTTVSTVQPLPTPTARAEEGTANSPLLPAVTHARGLIQLGKTEEAVQILKKHIALKDNDALAMRWLAVAQLIRGESASACVPMQAAYSVDPTLVSSALNVGFFPDGEEGAFATMMSAVTYANNKKTPTAYFTAAVFAQAANRPDTARRMLDRGRGAGMESSLADSLDAAVAR